VLIEDMVCMRAAVLSRPSALNAVNMSMVERLTELYAKCVVGPRCRAARLCAWRARLSACGVLRPALRTLNTRTTAQVGDAAARGCHRAQGRWRTRAVRRR
jgi:hypothetical protein